MSRATRGRRWIVTHQPPVFFLSGATLLVFVVGTALFPTAAEASFARALDFIGDELGWLYILSVAGVLLFSIWLAFSRFGHVKLGDDDDEPEFSTRSWLAMLMSAGMGIGIMFFGVAEPILHFSAPPSGEGGTAAAAREAMRITFFHWGLHAWGIYALVGCSLAYFAFRKKLPLTLRSALYPLLGERVHGWPGHLVDVLAVFGTVFGLATSLGLGAGQVASGLNVLVGWDPGTTTQLVIIAVITLCATASVVTGLDKGVKILSEVNMGLAALLLAFVFLAGPTVFLLRLYADSIGNYLQSIVVTTFRSAPFAGLQSDGGLLTWQKGWTLFYWGWWISWAPFVGMFIARISKGRTVRELVTAVLVVPTVLSFFWLTVFGGTALHIELSGAGGITEAVRADVATAIYELLDRLPLASMTSFVAALCVALFFITSSDSGSLVVDLLTSGGHPHPPVLQRVLWALTEGAVAATLLVAGGLEALQAAAIGTGLPFAVVLVLMGYSLVRALREEPAPAGADAATGGRRRSGF